MGESKEPWADMCGEHWGPGAKMLGIIGGQRPKCGDLSWGIIGGQGPKCRVFSSGHHWGPGVQMQKIVINCSFGLAIGQAKKIVFPLTRPTLFFGQSGIFFRMCAITTWQCRALSLWSLVQRHYVLVYRLQKLHRESHFYYRLTNCTPMHISMDNHSHQMVLVTTRPHT